jgi:hypothetical protein
VKEWAISLSGASTAAGDVTFGLTNAGNIPHEFIVVRSELSGEELLNQVDAATSRLDEAALDAIERLLSDLGSDVRDSAARARPRTRATSSAASRKCRCCSTACWRHCRRRPTWRCGRTGFDATGRGKPVK